MALVKIIAASHARLLEQSRTVRAIGYGLIIFVVIFGTHLLWHWTGWNWYREELACDALQATILGLIASYLSRLREEGILRREREINYLNHHIRNSLALIQMAEQQLHDVGKRAGAVQQASRRICRVLEQFSRRDDVFIDHKIPEKYERYDKAS